MNSSTQAVEQLRKDKLYKRLWLNAPQCACCHYKMSEQCTENNICKNCKDFFGYIERLLADIRSQGVDT